MTDESEFEPVQREMTIDENSSTIENLKALCVKLEEVRHEVSCAERQLKVLQEKEKSLSEEAIPQMMRDLALVKLEFENGTLELAKEYYAKIPSKRSYEAFKWLDENGHGAIIKTNVGKEFGKGDREKSVEFMKLLEDHGITGYDVKENVHPSTLKAFVKDILTSSDADTFPKELFGVFEKTLIKFK